MAKIAVSLPDDLLAQIDAVLPEGQSRSGWLAAAARARLTPTTSRQALEAAARGRRPRPTTVEPRFGTKIKA